MRQRSRVGEGEGEIDMHVQVVLAHDAEWMAKNVHAFWPGKI